MDPGKRRKRKNYIMNNNPNKKRKSDLTLVPGMKGFVCTCNGNEKGCIREALNILDEYDLKLNPGKKTTEDEEKTSDFEEDIEKQLKEEISTEKSQDKKFKIFDTGLHNCLFISAKVNDVIELGELIMKNAKEESLAKSRFLIRLVPVEITCKAYNDDIKKAADKILDAHFKCDDPVSYSVHINKRSNNNLLRTEVIDDLARLVRDRNNQHFVDLKNPSKTVVVEIIRNICCLSVVKNFFDLKKYNLIELGSKKHSAENSGSVSNETRPEESAKDSCETTVEEKVDTEGAQEDSNVKEELENQLKKEVPNVISEN